MNARDLDFRHRVAGLASDLIEIGRWEEAHAISFARAFVRDQMMDEWVDGLGGRS